MAMVKAKNPAEPEFHQAVAEVVESLETVLNQHPEYGKAKIMERIVEPERVIMFRVPWIDDQGNAQVNRGFRIEMNSAIGPYKGGLRFHPSVNLGILKFLAFEQVFKNSLTTLPMGGGKGGSDFDPKGKSDNEVMRFCQSFMTELQRHIGPDTDVPAGDIGVGGREVGFLFGQYKRLRNEFTGVLTGKGINWGGSLIRPEATGYGAVYFAAEMLGTRNETLEGKTCLVSGSGNVAQYTTEKINELGGKVVTLSDSSGFIHDPEGIDAEKLAFVMDLKNVRRGRISEYAESVSRTQSIQPIDANAEPQPALGQQGRLCFPICHPERNQQPRTPQNLLNQGVYVVSEGANMPTTPDGVKLSSSTSRYPVRSRQSRQRRWRGCLGSRNGAEQSMRYGVDSRGGGCNRLHDDYEEHPLLLVSKAAEQVSVPPEIMSMAPTSRGFLKVADAMMDQGLV